MNSSSDASSLPKYDRTALVMKQFNPFESRSKFGCPPRFCINTYVGCAHRCAYCYAWWQKGFDRVRPKVDFKRKLDRDIERALKAGLRDLPVSISNSTDPFQPIEAELGHTLYALSSLKVRGFKVIILTKNPEKLLGPEYQNAVEPGRTCVQVTIPFPPLAKDPHPLQTALEPHAPRVKDRLSGVACLVRSGFQVIVRIDPVIPRTSDFPGQRPEDFARLFDAIEAAGVRFVASKPLKLVGALARVSPSLYSALRPLYRQRGKWESNCYRLDKQAVIELLSPIYEECLKRKIMLSTCYEPVQDTLPDSKRCDHSLIEWETTTSRA